METVLYERDLAPANLGGEGLEVEHLEELLTGPLRQSVRVPHIHKFYEVIWFCDAGGIHTVDFVDYPVEENSVFFIAPGQVHHFDSTLHKGYTLLFASDFLNTDHSERDTSLRYNVFNAYNEKPFIVLNAPTSILAFQNFFIKLETEVGRKNAFGHMEFLQCMLRIGLLFLERGAIEVHPERLNPASTSQKIFRQFRLLIEQHYMQLHSVKDYAAQMNISTQYLNRSVSECTAHSPLQLITNRIILEAKRQLRYSDLQVKEIAFNLGYEDPSYFVKQFKRETGMLPGEFRSHKSEID